MSLVCIYLNSSEIKHTYFSLFFFLSSSFFFSFVAFNHLFTFFAHVWKCGNKWGALTWERAKTVHFRAYYNKGVSHPHLGLAVTPGQMGKWKLCSEIKGSLQVCSGWELLAWWTWKWTSYKCVIYWFWGTYLSLSGWSCVEAWQKLGKGKVITKSLAIWGWLLIVLLFFSHHTSSVLPVTIYDILWNASEVICVDRRIKG